VKMWLEDIEVTHMHLDGSIHKAQEILAQVMFMVTRSSLVSKLEFGRAFMCAYFD
jgi:hypothetical protein